MTIRLKLFLPLFFSTFLMGLLCYIIVNWELSDLKNKFTHRIGVHKMNQVIQGIDRSSQQALEQASLFTKMPAVIQAFEIAHTGDIDNEADSNVHHARKMLRRELKYILEGFFKTTGHQLKLHFHLPNGRSLVRLWREKQIQRNGQWFDVSDDISAFRQTVLDVNSKSISIKGIETGRGGFVVRGLAPVKDIQGKQLGSVEVLLDFQPILQSLVSGNQNLLLYMNADLLSITHRLQDSRQYPLIQDKYILVVGEKNNPLNQSLDISILNKGAKEFTISDKGNIVIAAFPVKDYKDIQVGVIAIKIDTSHEKLIISSVIRHINLIFMAVLIFNGFIIFLILSKSVLKPVKQINNFFIKLSKGDLTHTLEISQKDEIGALAGSLNNMVYNINTIFKGMRNDFNALSASINEIKTYVDNQASIISQQSSSMLDISSTISELLQSLVQIAKNSETVSKIADNELQFTEQGSESVEYIQHQITEINKDNQNIINGIIDLGKKTEEISKVMDIINNLAYQTKLIAFNAALEASSTGDAGKRFGVVASEIRRLADNVTKSTVEIENKINEIQQAVENMTINSETSSKAIQNGVEFSIHTAQKLDDIVKGAKATADSAKQISLATREQKTANEQIVETLKDIETGAKHTKESIEKIKVISQNLIILTGKVKDQILQFKLMD